MWDKMTEEQIKLLRRIIQDEIEVAGVDGFEHGVWGWMDSQLDKRWKKFQDSFNGTTTRMSSKHSIRP
jgi:hypothetical protein